MTKIQSVPNIPYLLQIVSGLRSWSEALSCLGEPIIVPGPDGTDIELESGLLDYADAILHGLNGTVPDEAQHLMLGVTEETETYAE